MEPALTVGHTWSMRPGTTIVLVALLALILGAATLQLILATR